MHAQHSCNKKMSGIIHLISSIILLVIHSFFLFRGFYLIRRGKSPKIYDRISKSMSSILLPVVVVSGLFYYAKSRISLFHVIVGMFPIVSIISFSIFRILSKKRKLNPWLLPLINYISIIVALCSGLIL